MADKEQGPVDASEQTGSDDEGGSILDNGGIDVDARAGRSLGIDFTEEPDEETKQQLLREREERLDPDNRPETAEVDNTERTFDPATGEFSDSETHDRSEPRFSDLENPNNPEHDKD